MNDAWLASLEPGISAAKDRLSAARRQMDKVSKEYETRPYDDERNEAFVAASIELDDATAVGQEFVLSFTGPIKRRRK